MRDEAYDQFQSPNGDTKVVDIVRIFLIMSDTGKNEAK